MRESCYKHKYIDLTDSSFLVIESVIMELRHLRYFLAVAEEGHFGRAAARLHIVQPALSMQIRALEEELGGPLFVRTSRRVELTEAGVLLREEARRTLDQAERARITARRAIRGEMGRVQIGFAGNAVMSSKLLGDLRAFRKAYPDAELVVREMGPQLQPDAILDGQLDIGYTTDYGQVLDPALKSEKVDTWRLMVAMSDDHPLAQKKRITAQMLTNEPLILYTAYEGDESLLSVLRRTIGCEPRVTNRAGSTLGVLALAASGLGLALVPGPVTQLNIPGIVYRPWSATGAGAFAANVNLMVISRAEETGGAARAYLAMARHKHHEAKK